MDPFTAGLIGSTIMGGLGVFGQNSANRTNREIARETMAFQDRQTQQAMAFSERMSSTAVQRSVEDYRRAGLNPALAYERSASSPSGVVAGGASATMQNTMGGLPNIVSSALAARQLKQQLEIGEAQIKNLEAQTGKTAREAANVELEGDIMKATMPHDIRLKQLARLFGDLDLTRATNEERLERWLQSLGGGTGARGLAGFFTKMLQIGASTRR